MPTWAVYLSPRGPVGQVRSDTLFGALCWAQRTLHGPTGIERFLAGLPDHPPCALSSCFPVVRAEGGVIRCYPTPMLPMSTAVRTTLAGSGAVGRADAHAQLRREMEATQEIKDLARAPYVSEAVFRAIVEEGLDLSALQARARAAPPQVVRLAGVWMDMDEARRVPRGLKSGVAWQDFDIPRNHIDRVAGATVEGLLFSVAARLYREEVGLWFSLQADALEPFLPLLRYLGDTGIGGHRSVGLSQFRIPIPEIHEVAIPSRHDSDRFTTLSRYIPVPGEVRLDDERSSYRLVTIQPKHEARGGVAGQRIYKGRLLACEEGSVLCASRDRKPFYGHVVPAGRNAEGPDGHQVWHNGVALPAFLGEGKTDG